MIGTTVLCFWRSHSLSGWWRNIAAARLTRFLHLLIILVDLTSESWWSVFCRRDPRLWLDSLVKYGIISLYRGNDFRMWNSLEYIGISWNADPVQIVSGMLWSSNNQQNRKYINIVLGRALRLPETWIPEITRSV